jgi:thiamine-phosphate pyrophosphorylase
MALEAGGPPDPQFDDILQAARVLAQALSGERVIATTHVLLALLRSEGSLSVELERFGFHTDRLPAAADSAPSLPLDEPLVLKESADFGQTERILDVNSNRAREALRVVEDYCRFVLNDRCLCSEVKQLRHDLAAILADIPLNHLLAARDTPNDVGTDVSTTSERERCSPRAVAEANLKRLQEALRSVEEFAKLRSPRMSEAVERIRYRAYTLEQAILLGARARQRLEDARLYVLVSACHCVAALDWTIAEAAAGGVEIFQLREKGLNDRDLLVRARQVRQWTTKAGVLFIMNDRADIARLADADGVHLGQQDLSVAEARQILGPDAIIGRSTHDLAQVRQAVMEGAGYIGVGPTFASGTKHFEKLAGLEFVKEVAEETSLPAFIIGGVGPEKVDLAVAAGARRVAVSQAICSAEDPRAVAAILRGSLSD